MAGAGAPMTERKSMWGCDKLGCACSWPTPPSPIAHRPRARVSTRAEGGAGSSTAPLPLLAPVLACVAVSCAGALAFGYHLAVVNGPLDAITHGICIAGNRSLEGMVRATVRPSGFGGGRVLGFDQ